MTPLLKSLWSLFLKTWFAITITVLTKLIWKQRQKLYKVETNLVFDVAVFSKYYIWTKWQLVKIK